MLSCLSISLTFSERLLRASPYIVVVILLLLALVILVRYARSRKNGHRCCAERNPPDCGQQCGKCRGKDCAP